MLQNRGTVHYLATFHTHTGAMKFEKALKGLGVWCQMKPVPRKLSSSCGVCVEYEGREPADLPKEDISRIYQMEGNTYHMVFENE